jgi:luciferase family oxidoreductase group 1
MSEDLTLSILDFQHPGYAVALACAADEWGFARYWIGEHHTGIQCANPLLLGALLAASTERIRIGSGGVTLAYRNPLFVAEDARLIEFMIPGRFDLGVTRGLMPSGPTADALLEGRDPAAGDYPERVRTVHALVTGRMDPSDPLSALASRDGGPPVWVLGLSPASARLAGSLGAGFCYSVYHSRPGADGPAVVREYRASFQPSPEFPEPAALIVAGCVCAATEPEARSLEGRLVFPPTGSTRTNQTGRIFGSPAQCAEALRTLAADFSVREVMIFDAIQEDQDARIEMYRLLAEELGLAGG